MSEKKNYLPLTEEWKQWAKEFIKGGGNRNMLVIHMKDGGFDPKEVEGFFTKDLLLKPEEKLWFFMKPEFELKEGLGKLGVVVLLGGFIWFFIWLVKWSFLWLASYLNVPPEGLAGLCVLIFICLFSTGISGTALWGLGAVSYSIMRLINKD